MTCVSRPAAQWPIVIRVCVCLRDPAPTAIYTLSLHDALPILSGPPGDSRENGMARKKGPRIDRRTDRKSTRLNSSHLGISYAVFCLKKKTGRNTRRPPDLPRRTLSCRVADDQLFLFDAQRAMI